MNFLPGRWNANDVPLASRRRGCGVPSSSQELMGTMLILVVVVVGLVAQLPTIQVHGLTATVLELDPLASQIGPDWDGEQGGIADSAAWGSNR